MITVNMLVGCCIASMFAGVFFGIALCAMLTVSKKADLEAQTEEALLGTPRPSFDKRA